MPASTLTQLLGFNEAFEFAAYELLDAAGIPTIMTRANVIQPDVVAYATFEPGAATDDVTADGEFNRYEGGTLSVILKAPRDDQAAINPEAQTRLGELAAQVRVIFRESQMPFETDAPFYDVYQLKPAGENYGMDEQRRLDTLTLRWTMSFTIRPDAWPVPEEPEGD